MADQYTNIAYMEVIEDRPEQALDLYRKALTLYERAGAGKKAEYTRRNIENLERSSGYG